MNECPCDAHAVFANGEMRQVAALVEQFWRNWPQTRRDKVRALSAHLADALDALKVDLTESSRQVITLPAEPPLGSVVEIVDGSNSGLRFERMAGGLWRELSSRGSWGRDVHWSWIWWAVCEDGAGGTSVRVVRPDPHPLPWRVTGERDSFLEDANGRIICEVEGPMADREIKRQTAERICAAVNASSAS